MSTTLALRPQAEVFFSLPPEAQELIRVRERAMKTILDAPNRHQGTKLAANELDIPGHSAKRLDYLCRTWLEAKRDWRILHDSRRWPLVKVERGLPAAFVEHWRWLLGKYQRKRSGVSAHEHLLRQLDQWRHGQVKAAIPGYDAPPANMPGKRHPEGWSYENLLRLKPSKFEREAQRNGRTVAASERPLVYTTRHGCWVGSHYMFDDLWHDLFVNSMEEKKAGRPLELFSHDYFSARKVRWGFRVRVKRDDGVYAGLQEKMTRLILCATLFLDGYSPRGTILIAEHGTAAIAGTIEEALAEISGGLITVKRSGFTGDPAHAGHYPGISRGNPRFKASLESSNNPVHNRLSALPGQTGKSVEDRPDHLHGLLKHNDTLLAASTQLPPDRAARLKYDLLTSEDFHFAAADIYRELENSPRHELEGWHECGHVLPQVLLAGQWHDIHQLSPAEAQLVNQLAQAGELPTQTRRLSRREVWDMGEKSLIKLPAYGVWAIISADLCKPQTIRNHQFNFTDPEVGPSPLRFHSYVKDDEGRQFDLTDRETYEVFVNPFAPAHLFVGDSQRRFLGVAHAITTPCRGDQDAVNRACGAAAKREAELLAPLRQRHQRDAREKRDAAAHNITVLEGTDKDDRARASRLLLQNAEA